MSEFSEWWDEPITNARWFQIGIVALVILCSADVLTAIALHGAGVP